MNDWISKIPDAWKIIVVLVAVFVAGASVQSLWYQMSILPDLVQDNTEDIRVNKALFEEQLNKLVSEIVSLKLELRSANCLLLREREPGLNLSECIFAPAPPIQ